LTDNSGASQKSNYFELNHAFSIDDTNWQVSDASFMRRTATLDVWAATIDVYFSLIEMLQNGLPPKVADKIVNSVSH